MLHGRVLWVLCFSYFLAWECFSGLVGFDVLVLILVVRLVCYLIVWFGFGVLGFDCLSLVLWVCIRQKFYGFVTW